MTARSGNDGVTARRRTRRRRILDAATARINKSPAGHHDYTLTSAVRVPMRDGVELLTDVYAPVEKSRGTVLVRTPYGRQSLVANLTARYYATHGYHVVNQSCRGTAGSGGDFEPFRAEIEDGADTVDWLRAQPWFGGRFAACGPSYLGYTAWALMMDPPPELATAVIAVSAHDNHWVAQGGGAFSLEGTLSLLNGLGNLDLGAARGALRYVTAGRRFRRAFVELPLSRAQETVFAGSAAPYREWLMATDPDDPVWRPMRLGQALERVDVPVLLQDGWQDAFPEQMIFQYSQLRRRDVDVALTIGPWTHLEFGTKGLGVAMEETLDWLAEHLDGTGSRRRPSPVRVFVSGVQEWRNLPEWPPDAEQRVLYLQPDGGLDANQPTPEAGSSAFTYDPARPTPAVGGRVINPTLGGYRDNRELEARDDVLTFTGPPLSAPVEVIGSPAVELEHRTDNPYADLFVRLCEVRSDGRSINLSDGFQRLAPERSSGTIRLRLEAMAHRFLPGTRIRLQISGGAHPRFARNLGTDEDPATGTTLAPSRRTIGHGKDGFSRILLPCPSPAVPDTDRVAAVRS
jgi:putative CocE/NonD family hydrolase